MDIDRTRQASSSAPTLAYLAVAVLVLGALAFVSSFNLLLELPNRDIWQHAASLRALIADLGDPSNPFVASEETSRHFHPLWVAGAAIAQVFDLSEWDILRLASYLSMFVLGLGVFVFARAYHPSPWAPIVLLLTMLFGWSLQPKHTGLHSFETLLFAAPYPATFMIGFSFILWALTIRSLGKPRYAWLLTILAAFMFATHQLGAVIGLIGAGCFALCWPNAGKSARITALVAMALGLAASLLWPYYNPLLLVLRPGNTTWEGDTNFYTFIYLFAAFVPAAIGAWEFRRPRSRPLALAFLIYGLCFLIGLAGVQIAGRFLMAMNLVLQIGLAACILSLLDYLRTDQKRQRMVIGGLAATVAIFGAIFLTRTVAFKLQQQAADINLYEIAQELTQDIPDTKQVAAGPYSVWPVVATGQRIVSIPWPEPGIHDLADRQAAIASLFDATLSREERISIARQYDTSTIIVDIRFWPQQTIDQLRADAVSHDAIAYIHRFDLFELDQ